MDFFERQEQARKRTWLLLVLFAAVLVAVLLVNYVVLATLIEPFLKPLPHARHRMPFAYSVFWLLGEVIASPVTFLKWLWDLRLAGWITLGTLLSVGLGCWYKMHVLAEGGSVVAELLGGRSVAPDTNDPDEQRLRHVVEEMAIASGMPVPEVYVLDNERGINAFSAGNTRQDIAIAVTRGALRLLHRDEIQGVVAHEFSHVLNGDTRLNMQLMALAHGLFWPTYLGRLLMWGEIDLQPGDESIFDEETASRLLPTAPIGIVMVLLGSTSLPFVRLLKSAVCRQREWLADASAVQFTRNPGGITGAFKKIGGLYKRGRLDTPMAEVASHLYFVNCASDSLIPCFATHPGLVKRIRAIEPGFDGPFPVVKLLAPNQREREQAYERAVAGLMMTAPGISGEWISSAGSLLAAQLQQASVLRLNLPTEVKQNVRLPGGAAGIIYGLLLSEDAAIRARQMKILRNSLNAAAFDQTASLAAQIRPLDSAVRFPLAELAVATLRQADLAEMQKVHDVVRPLVECDGAIELFEYALMQMVERRLRGETSGVADRMGKRLRLEEAVPQCELLLSALAHVGQDDEAGARKAFQEGAGFLDVPRVRVEFIPKSEWDLAGVDAALKQLSLCAPSARRNILQACGRTVVADGDVTVREAELLRSIADSLDCPVPPFVEAIRGAEMAREV